MCIFVKKKKKCFSSVDWFLLLAVICIILSSSRTYYYTGIHMINIHSFFSIAQDSTTTTTSF